MPGRLSVMQFIDYLRPFYPSWDRALESSLLNQTRLPARRKIHDLSHGMRAKLTLVCALAFRPKLLVLDEPFSGLDPLVRDDFMTLLAAQGHGCTQFISSHAMSEIEGIATHVGFIDRGVLLFQEPLADLRARIMEVRITVKSEARLPSSLPPEWLDVRLAGSEAVFIDTRFVDEAGLRAKINVAFGPVLSIEIRTVELRSIFTAIARALRREAR